MKKIYLLFIAIAMVAFCKESMAQAVTVTFEVDMHNFLNKAGDTIAAAGMRIAGTFQADSASTGGVKMAQWLPLDTTGKMTNLGDSVWSITVTFAAGVVGVGDSLQFKFVNGVWVNTAGCPVCTNEDALTDSSLYKEGCAPAASLNRSFGIPVVSGYIYKWCYDSCVTCNGGNALINGIQVINNQLSVFSLSPNPTVSKQSTLMYSVSEYSPVNIAIYNVLGQQVKGIVNENRPSGLYNQPIDLNNVSSGVYFIRLTSGNQSISKKIVVN